jgi:ribose-phosphate pyrophosphokinase
MNKLVLFTGSAHPELAASIEREAKIPHARCRIERFPDGEQAVRLLEPVRQRHVILVQPLSPPVNDHLMELLLLADACRRAAAQSIMALIPYFGYARSDKRHGGREAIGASMVADLLQTVGIDHIVTMDLHAPQIEGFFHRPVDCLTAVPAMCDALRRYVSGDIAVVSPDAGRVHMAAEYASRLGAPVVVLHKQRSSGAETSVTHLVGEVKDKSCIIIDDMISTGGTIANASEVLVKAGARPDITVAATHGIFVAGVWERFRRAGISALFVTDTVKALYKESSQLHIVSVAPLFAEVLTRVMEDGSFANLR